MGCIHIYCGDGKGKTTAALGLAVRMAGSGGRVCVARFLKNDDSGEVEALRQIKGIEVLPCEKSFGFTWQMDEGQKKEAEIYYAQFFAQAVERMEAAALNGGLVLLLLDELCAAINHGFVKEAQVIALLEKLAEDEKLKAVEIVMTGREPSERLRQSADYISEIRKVKHPFDKGLGARRGIEY